MSTLGYQDALASREQIPHLLGYDDLIKSAEEASLPVCATCRLSCQPAIDPRTLRELLGLA
jgi:hypothetical protein